MILSAFFFNPQGDHRVSWRHPRAPDLEVYDIAYFQRLAAAAEPRRLRRSTELSSLYVSRRTARWITSDMDCATSVATDRQSREPGSSATAKVVRIIPQD